MADFTRLLKKKKKNLPKWKILVSRALETHFFFKALYHAITMILATPEKGFER